MRKAKVASLPPALPSVSVSADLRDGDDQLVVQSAPVITAGANLYDDDDALVARATTHVVMVPTKAFRKAVQHTPGLQEDANRLLATYDVAALAAMTSMLTKSLAGHRAMGAAAYGLLSVEAERRLLDLARKAVRTRQEHGIKSQQAQAIGSHAMKLVRSALPAASHARARKLWDDAVRKVSKTAAGDAA